MEPRDNVPGNTYQKKMRFVDKKNYQVIILIFKSLRDLQKRRELYFENRDHKFGKELKKYICLVHVEDCISHPSELIKSYVYFQGEETTLQKLFG
ncbi:MAG TPA: hypothetical protein VNJ08_06965 [Bacteriovoracaceae bacterium]|nr:hypothetical protein [Bacteriovoracaceae bacterium]